MHITDKTNKGYKLRPLAKLHFLFIILFALHACGENTSSTSNSTITAAVAKNSLITLPEDNAYTGVLSVDNPDSLALTFSLESLPSQGSVVLLDAATGSFQYTPTADFNGSDSFSFSLTDDTSAFPAISSATVSITVNPVNDTPVATIPVSSFQVQKNTPLAFYLQGTDIDGDSLSFAISTATQFGAISVVNASTGAMLYTPNADYMGSDSFSFTVNDGLTQSLPVTANIIVVGQPPQAENSFAHVKVNTTFIGQLQFSNPENQTLSFTQVTGPTNGNVLINISTGSFSFTPETNFTGQEQFTWQVSDGTQTSQALIDITVYAEFDILFEDVTQLSGIASATHGIPDTPTEPEMIGAGLAVADIDDDGDEDLYLTRGTAGYNVLFENSAADLLNLGQATTNTSFTDSTALYGLTTSVTGGHTVAAFFADYDGDQDIDLLLGSIDIISSNNIKVHQQNDSSQFVEDILTGLVTPHPTFSFSMADYDKDNDLDLIVAHWRVAGTENILWQNNNGLFSDVSVSSALNLAYDAENPFFNQTQITNWDWSPNFADMNNDGWPDLLIAGDFATSKYLVNTADNISLGNRLFIEEPNSVLTDENAMGAAIGDYDNDGDLDWFVSSIYDPNGIAEGSWGLTGNRLYNNDGTGILQDASETTGVREGYWGWAACFADFNNDGHLDLFHVNGFGTPDTLAFTDEFDDDRSRLFMADEYGKFIELSFDLGIDDTASGRGISCFDYDLDGDLDILIINSGQAPKLYRNNATSPTPNHYLSVRLKGDGKNTQAIGGRVYLTNPFPAGSLPAQQMRELRAGSNFASQDPVLAHFGLGQAATVDVRVVWPDGTADTVCTSVASNQRVWVTHPNQATGSGCP